jgi:Na+/glutamate symporter
VVWTKAIIKGKKKERSPKGNKDERQKKKKRRKEMKTEKKRENMKRENMIKKIMNIIAIQIIIVGRFKECLCTEMK